VIAEKWLVRLVALLAFLVLARLLTPADFGLVALASVYVTFCTFAVDQGLGVALIQREDLEPGHWDVVFWMQFLIGVAVAVLTFVFAGEMAHLFATPGLAPVLEAFALYPLINSLSLVQQALLRRELRFRALAIRNTVSTVAGAIMGIGLAVLGYGVWSLVVQGLGGALVGLVVLWFASSWRPRFAFSLRHLRELIGFGVMTLAHNLLWTLAYKIDRLLLGRFAGAELLGFYSVGQRIVLTVGEVLVLGLQGYVVPVFSRVQQDREALLRGLFRAHRLIAFVALPTFIGIALTASELVPILLGPKWLQAVAVMQASALPILVNAFGFFLSSVLTAIGRPGLRLALSTIQASTSAIFVLLAIPWGPVAVALAMGAAGLLTYVLNLIMLRQVIGLAPLAYQLQIWPIIAATTFMAAVVWAVGSHLHDLPAEVLLMAKIGAGGLAYVAATLVVSRKQWREILELARSLRHVRPSNGGVEEAAG
jgi:PST family polysaccharide transporter